jgi:hypothetical protein
MLQTHLLFGIIIKVQVDCLQYNKYIIDYKILLEVLV